MRMRPTISWSDLRGARAGVWGLGVEGHANLRKLTALGADAVLVDDHPPAAGRGPAGPGNRRGRPGGARRVRRRDQVARHQPLPARGGRPGRSRRPGGRWPRAVAGRGRPRAGGLRHRDQRQEQRGGCRRAPAEPPRSPLPGGREHRAAALGPGCRPCRLRVLADRDIQLSGHRPALLATGRRGDLAAPRPPGLARRRGDLLPGQAFGLLPAGRGPDDRQRRQ